MREEAKINIVCFALIGFVVIGLIHEFGQS